MDAFENQDYPFEELVDAVTVTRDASRNPLFDIMFSLVKTGDERAQGAHGPQNIAPVPEETHYYENKTAKFDLSFAGTEMKGKVYFLVEYSTELFRKQTAEKFIEYYNQIIAAVIKDRNITLADINISDENPVEQKINNPQMAFNI